MLSVLNTMKEKERHHARGSCLGNGGEGEMGQPCLWGGPMIYEVWESMILRKQKKNENPFFRVLINGDFKSG